MGTIFVLCHGQHVHLIAILLKTYGALFPGRFIIAVESFISSTTLWMSYKRHGKSLTMISFSSCSWALLEVYGFNWFEWGRNKLLGSKWVVWYQLYFALFLHSYWWTSNLLTSGMYRRILARRFRSHYIFRVLMVLFGRCDQFRASKMKNIVDVLVAIRRVSWFHTYEITKLFLFDNEPKMAVSAEHEYLLRSSWTFG